jgi:molybdopterin synthase sulfur carrier subunit
MTVSVLTFGEVSDIVNTSSFNINNVADVDTLKQILEDRFPGLKEIKYAVAVDKKIVTHNATLEDRSIVALLPPFSGG